MQLKVLLAKENNSKYNIWTPRNLLFRSKGQRPEGLHSKFVLIHFPLIRKHKLIANINELLRYLKEVYNILLKKKSLRVLSCIIQYTFAQKSLRSLKIIFIFQLQCKNLHNVWSYFQLVFCMTELGHSFEQYWVLCDITFYPQLSGS